MDGLAHAVALHRNGDLAGAEGAYRSLLAMAPREPRLLYLLGLVLAQTGRFEGAIDFVDRALALQPSSLEALNSRGNIEQMAGRQEAALAFYDRALAIEPHFPAALVNRGGALKALERFDEALACYDRAVALAPDNAEAWNNRSVVSRYLGRFAEALAGYERAVALQPAYADAVYNLACLRLLLGDLAGGWPGFEARWRVSDPIRPLLNLPLPLWRGEPLEGRRILVFEEQGLGDTVQFCRLLPVLQHRGARVTFVTRASMVAFVRSLVGTLDVRADCPAEPFDYQCPLMSLPLGLGLTLDTIPAETPYLFSDAARVRRWRERLGSHGFKIGIAWAGSESGASMKKAFALADLRGLAQIPGVRLVCLQKGRGAEEARDPPDGLQVETLGEDFDAGPDAFLDTAAAMQSLDLIVSADTSIAHVAGALGRPVWVALPYVADWRWLLERADTPWYPTMRLFRQKARDDWSGVFAAIEAALRAQMGSAG
jgi:Flp pilus assembly protein TadD